MQSYHFLQYVDKLLGVFEAPVGQDLDDREDQVVDFERNLRVGLEEELAVDVRNHRVD